MVVGRQKLKFCLVHDFGLWLDSDLFSLGVEIGDHDWLFPNADCARNIEHARCWCDLLLVCFCMVVVLIEDKVSRYILAKPGSSRLTGCFP